MSLPYVSRNRFGSVEAHTKRERTFLRRGTGGAHERDAVLRRRTGRDCSGALLGSGDRPRATIHLAEPGPTLRSRYDWRLIGGPTTSSAKYIGRVGALALALGIGFAVMVPPGPALAEEADTSEGSTPDRTA